MKIAIMGAGGIGGYLGGNLVKAGRSVAFIARGAQLSALRNNGLVIESSNTNLSLSNLCATDNPAEIGPVDLILFCVKSYDVKEAAIACMPMMGPHTVVIPILNGVSHLETLQNNFGPSHLLGGFSLIGSNVRSPGVIKHYSSKALTFGEIQGGFSSRVKEIEEVLRVPGIVAKAVPDILEKMWWKFAMFCGLSVFCVIRGGQTTGVQI